MTHASLAVAYSISGAFVNRKIGSFFAQKKVSGTFCPKDPQGRCAQKVPDTFFRARGLQSPRGHCIVAPVAGCERVAVAAQRGVPFVTLEGLRARGPENNERLFCDAVHPTAEDHALIARAIAAAVAAQGL